MDVIDEALLYFKANVFFRNYEIKVVNVIPTSSNFIFIIMQIYNLFK